MSTAAARRQRDTARAVVASEVANASARPAMVRAARGTISSFASLTVGEP